MERDGSGQVGLTIISAFLGDRRSWRAAVGAPLPSPFRIQFDAGIGLFAVFDSITRSFLLLSSYCWYGALL